MINRINAARAAHGLPHGLPPLRESDQLANAAAKHSGDLASAPWLIDTGRYHEGSDGSSINDRLRREGYVANRWLEIVGWGWGGDSDQMFDWWMNSPVHKATILSPAVDEAGVGYLYAPGAPWGHYWTVNFGKRASAPEPPRPYTSHVPIVTAPGAAMIDLLRFKVADPDCWRVVRHPEGNQEDIQDVDLGGGLFVRRKNSLGEWHRYDDQFFYLVHDTSPAPGTEGIERVYTLYKDGKPGAPKSKRYQAVGEEWHEAGLHKVVFRAKDNCRPLGENSGDAQNHSTITRHERNYTFNRYGQTLTFDEVIWEKTGVEMQIYGRKDGRACGWLGWEAPWGSSEPVEVHWGRGRLTDEPSRICGF